MLLKKLNFKNYLEIKNLLKKNGSNLPTFASWKLFNDISEYNSSLSLDGLYFKKKLVGYHSIIEKKIIFRKKLYKVLVSSNWNVSKKFRSYSINLFNKYLNKKSDFYLTTTANKKTAKIWKSLGAYEINNISSKITLFRITDYQELIKFYLKKRKFNLLPNIVINLFTLILKIIFFKKDKNFNNAKFSFKKINGNSNELEIFNKKFEKKISYPIELRSDYTLFRYIKVLTFNKKKSFIFKILKNKTMVGYVVFIGENHNGLKRLFLGDFKILKKYEIYINDLLSYATQVAKINKYMIVYFKNFHPNILNKIKHNNYFSIKYDFNPYLIRCGSHKGKKLKKFFQRNWGSSYFDGDCLL